MTSMSLNRIYNEKLSMTPFQIQNLPKKYGMHNELLRLGSFRNWPRWAPVQPNRLARAGFFYTGSQDETMCFHCEGIVKQWRGGDWPDDRHQRVFPNCEFLLRLPTNNVPLPCPRHIGQLHSFKCYWCDGLLSNWVAGDDTLVENARWLPQCGHLMNFATGFIEQARRDRHSGAASPITLEPRIISAEDLLGYILYPQDNENFQGRFIDDRGAEAEEADADSTGSADQSLGDEAAARRSGYNEPVASEEEGSMMGSKFAGPAERSRDSALGSSLVHHEASSASVPATSAPSMFAPAEPEGRIEDCGGARLKATSAPSTFAPAEPEFRKDNWGGARPKSRKAESSRDSAVGSSLVHHEASSASVPATSAPSTFAPAEPEGRIEDCGGARPKSRKATSSVPSTFAPAEPEFRREDRGGARPKSRKGNEKSS